MTIGTHRLVLGTAQLGMQYGIANATGIPDRNAAVDIVLAALRAGVNTLDTAHCYGDAESILRDALALAVQEGLPIPRVITKLDTPLAEEAEQLSDKETIQFVKQGVISSCRALGLEQLPVLLIRESWPLMRPTMFWETLLTLREQGLIHTLGLSAQSPAEVQLALKFPDIRHLQVPINILDHRWRNSDVFAQISVRGDLTVHARSVFLQGLLLAGNNSLWPDVSQGCGPDVIHALLKAKQMLNRSSLADLCTAYVLSYPQISGVVLGLETAEQLEENLRLVTTPALSNAERKFVDDIIPYVPSALLNPSSW
ncbi:aldo/keto reductase [Thalassospira povalilytica]|uniref:Aldo/keto reductase n=1 Tax=Thalassospira povalilytica TaxID=732237 RepID=A0A8I1SKD4_9PROT|nr:aldo/keto reductase [Thalassospira povalilytica]MBN8197306.1 aldo/keto reductase [Thalassospira povalilytica]